MLVCNLNVFLFRWETAKEHCPPCHPWECLLACRTTAVIHRSLHSRWTWPRIHLPIPTSLSKPALHASELVRASQGVELLSNIALHVWSRILVCINLPKELSTLNLFTGPGILDSSYHPEDHKCKKDLLLGRIKHSENPTWKLIRPRPTKNQYVGPYYICKGEKTSQAFGCAIICY